MSPLGESDEHRIAWSRAPVFTFSLTVHEDK
jgi:hypothetical protein